MANAPDLLWQRLSDPEARSVLEDLLRERDEWSPGALLVRSGLRLDATANADAATADAYAYADADAYADAYAYAYADAATADAYADATAADAYADAIPSSQIGEHMKSGLYLWCQPSGSVVVLRIGWVRRVSGDEYEALNLVTPKRGGDYKTMLADVVIDGPPKNWTFTRPMPRPSPLTRWHILGPVSLDPEQWAKVCPEPDGWSDV